MKEFIYSYVNIVFNSTEKDINLGIKSKMRKVRIKLALSDISYFYESWADETNGITIRLKNGKSIFIIDDFDRIDKLHSEFLMEYDKQMLISSKQ